MPTTIETPDRSAAAGDHAVLFYENDAELAVAVADYLAEGIIRGAVAITITVQSHRRAFARELVARGIDLEAAIQSGTLVLLDAEATLARFSAGGRLDATAFDRVIGGLVRRAASGGRPVVAYGDMVAVLWEAGHVPAAAELEELWTELRTRIEFTLLCAYRSESVGHPELADALARICRLHNSVQGHVPSNERSVTRAFSPLIDSPRAARRFVDDALRAWGVSPASREDAELVISELASNAVIHAGSGFRVRASLNDLCLRLSVQDASERRPEIRESGPWAGLGLGLPTIDAVAGAWGVELIAGGKVVWAELGACR